MHGYSVFVKALSRFVKLKSALVTLYQRLSGTFCPTYCHILCDWRQRGFSSGQKNQFEVILALSQGADYILMDEPFAGNDLFNREDFYKVLLGILEPEETILLSTHLIEEVQHFISRAVLLHKGALAGDVTTLALEEAGRSLMDFLRETYHYRPDRVSQALSDLTDKE